MKTIFKRRSVRKYTETPVTDEQVKQIIRLRVQRTAGSGYLLCCAIRRFTGHFPKSMSMRLQ